MSRLATSFVLGYHGCDREVGLEAIKGKIDLIKSDKDYDWLGPGTYFWESDPVRAFEWAQQKAHQGRLKDPYVIGAVIDLRNCLDLIARENLEILKSAYLSYKEINEQAGLPLPENKNPPGSFSKDNVLRKLDCAIIRHLHGMIETSKTGKNPVEPFDTVRGMFEEGDLLYPGGGFKERTHIQISVRNARRIKGHLNPGPILEPALKSRSAG